MPQITVLGVPENASEHRLRALRNKIISTVEAEMGIKEGMTRVFFPKDKLNDPRPDQDNLIWAFLYTGMFKKKGWFGKNQTKLAKKTTRAIAEAIKAAFGGKIGVEVFVRDCDPDTKTLLRPD